MFWPLVIPVYQMSKQITIEHLIFFIIYFWTNWVLSQIHHQFSGWIDNRKRIHLTFDFDCNGSVALWMISIEYGMPDLRWFDHFLYTIYISIQNVCNLQCFLMFDRNVDVNKHDQNECNLALCRVQFELFMPICFPIFSISILFQFLFYRFRNVYPISDVLFFLLRAFLKHFLFNSE